MQPTEENLLLAMKQDEINRNKDLKYFYNLLKAQKEATSIAIDGRWGSGKTFFVKQEEMILTALNPLSDMEETIRREIISRFSLDEEEEASDCSLAVYYDAWENDNDNSPIFSIIYELTKQLSVSFNISDNNYFEAAGAVLEAITGRNVNQVIESLKSDEAYNSFKEQKNISSQIKEFLTDIMVERGNRLVVFIDELDRCKPDYAVSLLEDVKHYLCDDRITFVFSVNLEQLQHTIKHCYGEQFDSCRYLDRFFDLRVDIPPASLDRTFDKLGLNTSYYVDKISKRVIQVHNLELREISKFYSQVKASVYDPTHDGRKYNFDFPDGKGRQLILMTIVPLMIALKIADTPLYNDFVNGTNSQPLVDLFSDEDDKWILKRMLNDDESFVEKEDKKLIDTTEIIERFYQAVFGEYSGNIYSVRIGHCEFDKHSKKFAITSASMLSDYADLS